MHGDHSAKNILTGPCAIGVSMPREQNLLHRKSIVPRTPPAFNAIIRVCLWLVSTAMASMTSGIDPSPNKKFPGGLPLLFVLAVNSGKSF